MPLIDFVQHAYVSLDCGIIVDAKGANSDVERLWSGQQAMHNIQQAFLHLMSLRQNTCVTQHAATVCELEGWAWPGKLIQSHSWHMQRGVSNRSRTQGSVGDEGRQGSAGLCWAGGKTRPRVWSCSISSPAVAHDEIFPSVLYNSRSVSRVSLREYYDR